MTGLILDVGSDWQTAPSPAQPLSPSLWWGDNTNLSVLASSHSPKITCRVSAVTWLVPRKPPPLPHISMEFFSTLISISSPDHTSAQNKLSECIPSGILLWNTWIFKTAFHSVFQHIFPLHLGIHLQLTVISGSSAPPFHWSCSCLVWNPHHGLSPSDQKPFTRSRFPSK